MSAAAARPLSPLLLEVREGLSRVQKELPSKLFYDRRGSLLFEKITRLPEYYLTRAERTLLATRMPAVIARLAPRTLVELGAGSADKTRLLLDAMRAAASGAGVSDGTYVPIDVSAEFLRETTTQLGEDRPGLRVLPVVADMVETLALPRALPRPALFALLGSTIGNFDFPDATALLRRVRDAMCPGGTDRFLLGIDLRKDQRVIEAAYNDAAGVTEEFNLNMLRVVNRELDADFDLRAFAHRAIYNAQAHRIEMHLVAQRALRVSIAGMGVVCFRAGESIRTEISCKYHRASVARMFAKAGLLLEEWIRGTGPAYALALGSRAA
ncbi:MAG TPA: L-histidine N(alpha)-methyltransferase [Gemmatimonadaceae bacterium]